MTKDARSIIRGVLPSHVQLGSEPLHERELLQEDYSAQTVGGSADDGEMRTSVWPGDTTMRPPDNESECPFFQTAHALNEYAAGSLPDDEVIQLFEKLVSTGLIEYMNESVRGTATALARAGYIRMQEADAFKRDVSGQQAQQGLPNIQVGRNTMYRQTGATAPVSTSDIDKQPAQRDPAQVPEPPSGQVTSRGYDTFPASGGKKENPAKIPRAAGTQKAGPNHGDGMSGGHGGIEVGNSLQQSEDPQADKGDYEGSKVGQITEQDGAACGVIPPDFEDDIYGSSQTEKPRKKPPARTRRPRR